MRSAPTQQSWSTGSPSTVAAFPGADITVSDYAEIVAALRAVPGVSDADVEPDADGGGVGLLRLGLTPGVDEVQVATNVGRLLRERFGLGVDADRVQLIEDSDVDLALTAPDIRPTPAPAPAAAAPAGTVEAPRAGRRVAIRRMQLVSSGLEVTAAVTLGHGDQTVTGEATGTATSTGVHRSVASATLRALEQLVGDGARFEVEGVEVTVTGGERTVVVALTMVSGHGSERLTGSATVREDVRQACVRAALDALNRRLEPLLPQAS